MQMVTLGSTGIKVNTNGFGALPIQRVSFDEARQLMQHAYANGIRYFDTARNYSDSEAKLAYGLGEYRKDIYIATKSSAKTPEELHKDLSRSLEALGTDYIDVYQFHNPPFVPRPGMDQGELGAGLYEAALEMKAAGLIKHIGFTNHKIHLAEEAVESGLYETVQFPFSYIASPREIKLVKSCEEHNVGFICMKGMAGGLLSSGTAAFAFIAQYKNALPIWGVQNMGELDEFLACNTDDFQQKITPELSEIIEKDTALLTGDFCRGCGYCMPCPQGIRINDCNRMTLMLGRAPIESYTTPLWVEEMNKVEDCVECGQCIAKCPYDLNVPVMLRENLASFRRILAEYENAQA